MGASTTVEIPAEIKVRLHAAAEEEGVSDQTLAVKALEDFLFLRRFRKLRSEMSLNIRDEEVFDPVS